MSTYDLIDRALISTDIFRNHIYCVKKAMYGTSLDDKHKELKREMGKEYAKQDDDWTEIVSHVSSLGRASLGSILQSWLKSLQIYTKGDCIIGLLDQRESKSHSFPIFCLFLLPSHYLKLSLCWILRRHTGNLYGWQKRLILRAADTAAFVFLPLFWTAMFRTLRSSQELVEYQFQAGKLEVQGVNEKVSGLPLRQLAV